MKWSGKKFYSPKINYFKILLNKQWKKLTKSVARM